MKLLVATRNHHKLVEIRQIFSFPGLILAGADEFPGLPEVEETGVTFRENALKKARELSNASGLWTMADDSGLVVDALNGAPGVYSARYAGENATTADNNKKLLSELEGVTVRSARFCCVIALCSPGGREWSVEGVCEGSIISEYRGMDGFGYDPLFLPVGKEKTFAELGMDEKNRISHRGNALAAALDEWSGVLEQLSF